VICSRCLERKEEKAEKGKFLVALGLAWKTLLGFVVAWLIFYYFGKLLILIPTSFHDGTIWNSL
jgi:hypothetical protein